MCLLWPHYRGAMFQELKPCSMRSQSHGRLWPLLKLKFGNCWLTSKCGGSSCKTLNSGSQFQFQSLQLQFHFQFHQFQFQLELSCNSNSGIELTPTLPLAHWNTPHIPSCYNNEQTTQTTNKSFKQLIYIHISCKCDTNRAGHFTLDAHASRPVACAVL